MGIMTIWSHFQAFVLINLPRETPLPAIRMNAFESLMGIDAIYRLPFKAHLPNF